MLKHPWHPHGMGVWEPHLTYRGEVAETAREWLSKALGSPLESTYYYYDVAHLMASLALYARPQCIIHPHHSPLSPLLHTISYLARSRSLSLPPGVQQYSQLVDAVKYSRGPCLALIDVAGQPGATLRENELANIIELADNQGNLLIVDLGPLPAYTPGILGEYRGKAVAITEAPLIIEGGVRWVTVFHGPRPLVEALELLSPLTQAQSPPKPPESSQCFHEIATRIRSVLDKAVNQRRGEGLPLPYQPSPPRPGGSPDLWKPRKGVGGETVYEVDGRVLKALVGSCGGIGEVG